MIHFMMKNDVEQKLIYNQQSPEPDGNKSMVFWFLGPSFFPLSLLSRHERIIHHFGSCFAASLLSLQFIHHVYLFLSLICANPNTVSL